MENRTIIKLFFIITLFLPIISFAYSDNITHPYLSGKAVDLFEQTYGSTFSSAEKQLIIQGSINEDSGVRWLKHFYDPVNNRGLNKGQFSTSKLWAHNQASIKNNYSWESAIYEYVYGNKNQGLLTLGHILHLLQDKTVPEHTRDDPHPLRSTYESFTRRNLPIPKTVPMILPSLDAYFDNLANFTNHNFFSDDTILKDYSDPKILKDVKELGTDGKIRTYGYGAFNNHLVFITNLVGTDGHIEKTYSIYDKVDNKVMIDYWNTLAPKAIAYNAGAIKLFFTEVEKEKQTGAIKLARQPWWQKLIDQAKLNLNQALASVRLAQGNESPKISPILATVGGKILGPNLPPAPPDWQKLETEIITAQNNLIALADNPTIPEQKISSIIHSVNSLVASLPTEIKTDLELELPLITEATSTTLASLDPPTILVPNDFSIPFATSTIIFSGIANASATAIFIIEIPEATTTVGVDGTWTLAVDFTLTGTTTLNFVAQNDLATSSATTITFAISSSTESTTNLTVNLGSLDCDPISNQEHCLILNKTTTDITWSVDPPGDYHYKLYKFADYWSDYKFALISEETKILLTETDGPYSVSPPEYGDLAGLLLEVYDQADQLIATTTKDVWFLDQSPILINEIGWSGTSTETSTGQGNEWIELANYLPFPISLTNLKIKTTDNLVEFDLPTTDFIARAPNDGNAYYLIERQSDEVVADQPANFVTPFSITDDGEADLLNNTGFSLKLIRAENDSEQVLDETPFFDRQCEERQSPNIQAYQLCWPDPTGLGNSIERYESGTTRNSWQLHWEDQVRNGLDRNGQEIYGTPGRKNTYPYVALW